MKKLENKKAIEIISPLLAIGGLLYIRYYESTLYYQPDLPFMKLLDILYSYVAIPFFYIFVTMYILMNIREKFDFSVSQKVYAILRKLIIFFFIFYLIFLVIIFVGTEYVKLFPFVSKLSVIYVLIGVLCAFAVEDSSVKCRQQY